VIIWKKYYAFRFPWEKHTENQKQIQGTPCFVRLGSPEIKLFFHDDPARRKEFLGFVSRGFEGWLLVDNGQWVTYGWLADCRHRMPPHIKLQLNQDAAWIFYCGTRESSRGKGSFQRFLNHIIREEATRFPHRELYIDTTKQNVPSGKAIQKSEFQPCGVITTYSFRLPFLNINLKSCWRRAIA
jgi:hypothetical protein